LLKFTHTLLLYTKSSNEIRYKSSIRFRYTIGEKENQKFKEKVAKYTNYESK